MKIIEGVQETALKIVIYGPEGIGKSTLASQFPDPLFLDLEGGTNQLNVKRASLTLGTWDELIGIVNEIIKDPSICRTLVIDTADAAERICLTDLLAKHNKTGIEDFGYGKGYTYLGENFEKLLNRLSALVENGTHVVLLSHSKLRKFEQPDEMGAYDRYELKLTRQIAPLVKEWSDMLLFLNYKTYVEKTGDNKFKATGGKRMMYANHHPSYDAKNRFGMKDEMELSYDAIKEYIIDEKAPKPEMSDMALLDDDVPFTLGEEDDLDDTDFKPYPIEETVETLKKLMGPAHLTDKDVIAAMISGNIQPDGDPENPGLSDFKQSDLEDKVIARWDGFKKYALNLKETRNEQQRFK